MAASWQNHIHLFTTATPGQSSTANEYTGRAPNLKPRVTPAYTVIAAPQYSLNGTLYAHVLKDGAAPIVFTNWNALIKCESWGDVEALSALLGDIMYFVFNWHDPVLHHDYIQRVYIDQIGEIEARGTTFGVISVPMRMRDATTR